MDKKKYLDLKNKYKKGILKNGMKFIISDNPLHNTASIVFFVRVGSRNESTKEYGLAHLLEHILFKGTKKYPTYKLLNERIDSLHINTNAGTTKNYTNFFFKLPSKNFLEGLELLKEIIFNSIIDENELKKEKKVVIEEINQSIDDSIEYAGDLLDINLYKNHPLSHLILGNKQNVRRISRGELFNFYKKYYIPNNICLALSGNIPNNINKILENMFMNNKSKNIKFNFKNINLDLQKPNFLVKNRKREQIAVCIGIPIFNIYDNRKYICDIISSLLYGNMTSRLWIGLREKNPLVYGCDVDFEFYEEGGAFKIELGLSKKNLGKAFNVIFKELNRLKNELINKKELDYIRNNLIEDLLEEEEDNLEIANYYGELCLLDENIVTYKNLINIYSKINSKQIRELSNEIFDFSKCTIVEVGDVSQTNLKKLFFDNINL